MTPPPWLPDWRDTSGYPDPASSRRDSSTARWRWRWEFQRRDPAYQRDCAEASSRHRLFWLNQYWLREPVDPASPRPPTFLTPRKWRVLPAGKGDQRYEIIQKEGTALVEFDLDRSIPQQIKEVAFLLQAFVEERHRLGGRGSQWRPQHWLRYLRLLDADACAAPKDEIARVLYLGLKNDYKAANQNLDSHLRDDRLAALQLCRGGYARLFNF